MLEYCKTILEKVSFDPHLFEKEYKKSKKWLLKEEIKELRKWVKQRFKKNYPEYQ